MISERSVVTDKHFFFKSVLFRPMIRGQSTHMIRLSVNCSCCCLEAQQQSTEEMSHSV